MLTLIGVTIYPMEVLAKQHLACPHAGQVKSYLMNKGIIDSE